jgi:hypothetical protein
MDPLRAAGPRPSRPTWRMLLGGSLLLAAIGVKFWIIGRYANATPFWDQWDGEAAAVYVPFYDSTLRFADLLRPHNEHRLLASRLLGLALTAANGLWDPILQMMANALIHVGFGLAVIARFHRSLDDDAFAGLAIGLLLILIPPYAIESVLLGFQTHFYAFLLLGFVAVTTIAVRPAFSPGWLAGAVVAFAAFFTLACGALVELAAGLVVLARLALGVTHGLREWLGAALLLAGFAVMLAFIPPNQAVGAQSAADFLGGLLLLMSWPLLILGLAGALIVNLPALLLAVRIVRRRPAPAADEWALLGLVAWLGLSMAAIAYGRTDAQAPRYLDIAAAGLVVNFLCAARLASGVGSKIAATGWSVVIVACLVAASLHLQRDLANYRSMTRLQEANVRTFLATGAFPPGAAEQRLALPYPKADRLAAQLADPRVQRFLPSNLQSAIPAAGGAAALPRHDRLGWLRDGLLAASGPVAILGLSGFAVALLFAPLFGANPLPALLLGRIRRRGTRTVSSGP